MTALALIIPGTRTATPVSADLAGPAVEFGGGNNIVNVILVDVRAWDTYGEVTVLIAAATGVASLIFLVRRTGRTPRRPTIMKNPVRPHSAVAVAGHQLGAAPVAAARGRHQDDLPHHRGVLGVRAVRRP